MNLQKSIQRLLQITSFLGLLIINAFVLHFMLDFELFKTQNDCDVLSKECLTSDQEYFGFSLDHFQVTRSKVKSGQLLPKIFSDYGLSQTKISSLIGSMDGVLNLRNIRQGNSYAMICSNECKAPDYFVYEIDAMKYLVCDLSGQSCPRVEFKQNELKREEVGGYIKNSLWNALQEQGVSINIIDQMEDALATSVDFHHLQEGNSFKLVFDRHWIEGQPSNMGDLVAAYFNTNDKEHYAFKFDVNNRSDYYDYNGRPLKAAFLKAPVRFSRITSGFTMRRFHPVLKYARPHFGTDYAAPTGTPIMAVGNGVVSAAAYSGGNGKFVKIKHDKTYESQYLHMSRFAAGIRAGSHVSQGQIIGYVGSTGLATGPHVCFRFWRNGTQVDHRKLNFPSGEPMPFNLLPDFGAQRDELMKRFNQIKVTTAYNRDEGQVRKS